jgi:hypothetical protein
MEKVTSLNKVVPPNETDILLTLITVWNIELYPKISERPRIMAGVNEMQKAGEYALR